jgi:hypothetical protein
LQCIDIIVLILARSGFNEEANYETAYQNADHRWLTIITTGGYILIFAALIVAAIIGDQAHVKLVGANTFTEQHNMHHSVSQRARATAPLHEHGSSRIMSLAFQ